MKAEAFHLWLRPQYTEGSAANRVSRVRRVEAAYGDLDAVFEHDKFAGILADLTYSTSDDQREKPNPTPINIGGDLYKQLASLKNAVARYREFLESGDEMETVAEVAIEVASESIRERREARQFELERHLQESLRGEIAQLESGLTIIDGDVERNVESGYIDILAQDAHGSLVVIELKRGIAKRDAIGQIAGYVGDLMAEEPERTVRGILVAGDFDVACTSAVRAIPTVKLKRYRFAFTFDDI